MLDCRRVQSLRLRFPNRQLPDLVLGTGVHGVGYDSRGALLPARAGVDALLQFCVDRRGVWLRLDAKARGIHVNGRPVRQMAMLRVGDAIYLDGAELLLLGAEPVGARTPLAGSAAAMAGDGDPRILLRGVGGHYHGRSFTLERPRLVGRGAECDIRIDDPTCAERHARIELHGERIVLRDLTAGDGSSLVNGEPARDAWLQPGDQLVFDAHQRFIIEAPGRPTQIGETGSAPAQETPPAADAGTPMTDLPQNARRLPWLLLVALLIAGLLSALLLFGSSP